MGRIGPDPYPLPQPRARTSEPLAASTGSARPADSAQPSPPIGRLLVMGGSQGSRAVNDLVLAAAAVWARGERRRGSCTRRAPRTPIG